MVEAEEQKMQQRKEAVHEQELKDEKAGKFKPKNHDKKHTTKQEEHKDNKDDHSDKKVKKGDGKDDSSDNKKK